MMNNAQQLSMLGVLLSVLPVVTFSTPSLNAVMPPMPSYDNVRQRSAVVQVPITECIDRCHRSLDSARNALAARTHAGMVRSLVELCPVQMRTLSCAYNCPDFTGKEQLVHQINYVGFLCEHMAEFAVHRSCYIRHVSDETINSCSQQCAAKIGTRDDSTDDVYMERIRRSCQLNECKLNCIYSTLYNNCANSTRTRIEAASLIRRWLAIDYQIDRLEAYNDRSLSSSLPAECSWVLRAAAPPSELSLAAYAITSTLYTTLVCMLICFVVQQ